MDLGKNQVMALGALIEHHGWWAGCGWYMDNYSNTVRILDSLVKRGAATREANGIYRAIFHVGLQTRGEHGALFGIYKGAELIDGGFALRYAAERACCTRILSEVRGKQ